MSDAVTIRARDIVPGLHELPTRAGRRARITHTAVGPDTARPSITINYVDPVGSYTVPLNQKVVVIHASRP